MNETGFEIALRYLRDGRKVCRAGWNGKGMYVVYQKGYPDGIAINENTANATGIPQGTTCKFLPYLMLKTVAETPTFVPWMASQTDLLEKDWEIVDE